MGWTPQQQDAINSTGRSVIVSAAAGSGKTAVLVERLIQQIIDEKNPIRADKIIIVTFTNNAAAELRQRINLKLQEIINENAENRFLLKQYTLFQSAKIATINSFCFDILRNNAEHLDITSSFSILDESENSLMEIQAAEETMELWSKKTQEFGFLYDKFCVKDDENIKLLILEINRFISSMLKREIWLENTEKELQKDYTETIYYKKFIESAKSELQDAYLMANENFELIEDMFTGGSKAEEELEKKLTAQLDDELVLINKCIESIETGEIPHVKFDTLPSKRGLTVCDKYKKNRDKYKNILSYYSENAFAIKKDIQETCTVFSLIKKVMLDFYDILWEKKCKKNALNFDDGERLVIDLLLDYDENGNIIQSEFAKNMADEYDIIMIDEYQDSNNKQDMIFKLISKNFNPITGQYGENVFLVGDIKQSIYRFRLANPDNFINTFKTSEPYSENSSNKNVSISLNKNFRSSPEVIDYVNYVFENLMSEKYGDIKYDENEKLYFGAESEYPCSDVSRKTEIAVFTKETPETTDEDDVEYEENDIDSEALYISEKISDMIKNNYQVNLKDGKKRACRPKDFCILMRVSKYSKIFVEALKKKGVYAKGEEEKGYLKSREIVILLDILRIIDNPLLDIPVTAVMMSPMFIFMAQDISEIRAVNKENKMYINVLKISEGEYDSEISEVLKAKCQNFIDVIKDFRMYSIVCTIEELIEKIYDTTDFLTIMQQFVDGEKKKANLRALIQYAKNYEENTNADSNGGLSGFLRYIERIQANKEDLPQGNISAMSEDFVSIKTIHKSKGLEYPFIFLVKTNINFKNDNQKTVLCSQDNKIGFKLNQPDVMRKIKTVPFEQINKEVTAKSLSEELRLLYVALTRAKQKLFITLSLDKKVISLYKAFENNKFDTKKTIPNGKCLGDWIWLTLFINKKFEDIIKNYELEYEFDIKFDIKNSVKSDCDLFDIIYFSKSDTKVSEEIISIDNEVQADPLIIKNIKNIMNYAYDFSRSEIPAKMSVSQFISHDEESHTSINQPQFILENTKIGSGTQRGSAIHKFFQFMRLDLNQSELEDEIINMIDHNYFTQDEAMLLPFGKIKSFLNNPIYKRIQSAEKIEREKIFKVEINDLDYKSNIKPEFLNSDGMLIGVIDLIIYEPDGLVILDYKSDRGISESSLKKLYSEQLKLYKSALELITEEKVKEVIIYSVELEKTINLDI